jgi:lipoprotein NlpD
MKLNAYLITTLAIALSACGTTGLNQAPVVERSLGTPAAKPTVPTQASAATPAAATSTTPAARPAITGASYVVKRGDTLYHIALENGLSYRDIAAWNGITNPNYIQADQVLRLTAPPADASAPVAVAVAIPVVTSGPTTAPSTAPAPTPAAAPTASVGDVTWGWPVKGKMIEGFTEGKSKGISIAGNTGDAIFAAADGKVVYAGSALKGYGPMLIIKHNDVFITAYAHNSKLLVKEEQTVKRGQHIADMGNAESEGGKTKLHFELRRNGKPLDPTKVLPAN